MTLNALVRGPRVLSLLVLALLGCQPAAPAPAVAPSTAGPASPTSSALAPSAARPFRCNLVLGVQVTSEWFEGGFERVVDDAHWEAMTKPHTSLEQWADPHNAVWSLSPSSPCENGALAPDRVLFTAMNWEYTTAAQWHSGLVGVVRAIEARFPSVREIDLLTMIRAPGNASCGNAMSVVQPFVDEAVAAVAAEFPERVQIGPKLVAPNCAVFKNGGPHFTDEGRSVVAKHIGEYFAHELSPTAAPAPAVVFPSEPIEPVAAPFPVPPFVRPTFPAAVFDIRDFGAIADGKTKNTNAIRKAIQKAVNHGGGSVLVPPGRWLTGPVRLQSNINLYVTPGAELLFSQDFADYLPPVFTRWEGTEMYGYSPLIYAKDCENVAITGSGTLNGQGEAWFPWKKSRLAAEQLYDLAAAGVPPEKRVFATEGTLRPSFIQTVGCKNVLIEGVTITSGPFWTIHPVYSENVIIRRVHVETEGPNTDGCDPDSSKNVLIEDSFFSTGDDCVVIKSGLNEDGWRVGKPSENIIVRRLHGEKGHGGVVIGSEMSGGVKNVWVTDSVFTGTDRGLRIKSMRGRGGTIENVFYENVKHENLRLMAVEMTTFYNSSNVKPKTQTPPAIRGVHVKNISTRGAAQAIDIVGLPELPIRDLTFEDVEIASRQGVRCIDCEGVRFLRTKITPASGAPFQLDNARSVSFDESCTGAPSACIERVSRASTDLRIDGKIVPARALPLHPKPVLPWPERATGALIEQHPNGLTDKWEYDSGLVLKGMLALWKKRHDEKYFEYVKLTIDDLLDDVGNIKGFHPEEHNLDAINMGKVLFPLLAAAKDEPERARYRHALAGLREQLKEQPRTSDGGFWHKQIYPHQMWLDGIYMAAPFLAEYGVTFAEPAALDDAVHQVLLAEQHLRDPKTGLLYHGWDETRSEHWSNPKTGTSSQFWGRSLGWYAMAVVDILEILPRNHPQRAALRALLERVAKAIVLVQDKPSGVWWQVLDAPGRAKNYREASASAMFVYALAKAVRLGLIERKQFEPAVASGARGLLEQFASVDERGSLHLKNICKVAGLGGTPYRDGSYAYYTSTEISDTDPKGIGAFILAATETD